LERFYLGNIKPINKQLEGKLFSNMALLDDLELVFEGTIVFENNTFEFAKNLTRIVIKATEVITIGLDSFKYPLNLSNLTL
jgi:hypothetical protein